MKPLVGVICCDQGPTDDPVQGVYERYLRAGPWIDADLVLVPSMPEVADAARVARRLDGVLLTGSPSNVEPRCYGSGETGQGPFDPRRDATAMALIEACARHDRPLLGICRGFQEVAVAFGGTLRGDLGDAGRAQVHHLPGDIDNGTMFAWRHRVDLTHGGMLARALAAEAISVNSAHFQGVAGIGHDLLVEGTSADGIVEAVRPASGARMLAVQWHPEWRAEADPPSLALFRLFAALLRGASWEGAVASRRAEA